MFQKAQRTKAKLKIALTGPSGSGKTYSALRLATGLGGKIAVIDTENNSASLYSDRFEFDTCKIEPPYTIDKYIDAIEFAVKSNYDVLIVDSITHQWKGEGGILNMKEQLDARGGDSFRNWAKMSPLQERFLASILHSQVHTICTIRSKQEYAMVEGDKGKHKIQKLGLAPIQRDGMEYEFTTVFDIAMNHEAEASKDRTGLFDGQYFKISEATGKVFNDWLSGAAEAPVVQSKPAPVVHVHYELYKIPFGKPEINGKTLNELSIDTILDTERKIIEYYNSKNIDLPEPQKIFIEYANRNIAERSESKPAKVEEQVAVVVPPSVAKPPEPSPLPQAEGMAEEVLKEEPKKKPSLPLAPTQDVIRLLEEASEGKVNMTEFQKWLRSHDASLHSIPKELYPRACEWVSRSSKGNNLHA